VKHHCALCGYRFDDVEMRSTGCPACPSRTKGCGLVRCPACGYEWPGEKSSRLARLFTRIFGGGDS
jgi:predicted Zn-ribbon and HTH transcriptional regulator